MAGARFNPTRSSKSTFVNRIVNRRIISILRHFRPEVESMVDGGGDA